MSVTEKLNGQGQFSLTLKEEAPESLVDVVDFAGHIVITTERMDPTALSDADFRNQSRYMGVVVYRPMNQTGLSIKGKGLVWWLGDGEKRGKIFRGAGVLDFVNKGFDAGWTDILATPTPITKGTIEATGGTYTHKFDLVTQRQAAERFASAFGAEFRINKDFTLDSGASGFLYNAAPSAVIARKFSGNDPETDGLVAKRIDSTEDIEDFVTTAVVAAEGTGDTLQTSEQSLGDKLFLDPQGNDIDRTKIFNEPETTTGDASDRAQLFLDEFGLVKKIVKLNLEDFHIKGEFEVGDLIYVWDPKTRLKDNANELTFRGQVLNPIAIRVVGMSWPIVRGMGVYYRSETGTYTDLTDDVAWEKGPVTVEVGASSRNLVEGTSEALDARITIDPDGNDTLTPNQPTHKATPWSTFQDVSSQGVASARIVVEWNTPTNTDSSTVEDGLGFNVRYRKQGETEYSTQFAAWGLEAAVIEGLTPGVVYELNVEAGDVNSNYSGYATVSDEVVTAATDGAAPSQPSAPTVAGNALNIQVTHNLQKQATGDLESDLDHLNVYVDTVTPVVPAAGNKAGEIKANQAMITLGLSVVATFAVQDATQRYVVVTAVDRDGNESAASPESTVTANLIDTQHITNAAITTALIGDLQVARAKIVLLAVDTAQIEDLAVETAKIGLLAVDTAQIALLAVGTAQIQDAAIENAKIGSLAVDTAEIANLAVETAKIDDLAVTEAKIGLLSVDTAQIKNLAVETAKIGDLAVTTAKIGDLEVTSAKIGDLEADKITAGTIGAEVIKLADLSTSRIESFDGTSLILRGNGTAVFTDVTISTGDLTITDGTESIILQGSGWAVGAAEIVFDVGATGDQVIRAVATDGGLRLQAGGPTPAAVKIFDDRIEFEVDSADRFELDATNADFKDLVLIGVNEVVANVGSASDPSYTFDGDTDTGMYRIGANDLGFTTGGVERLSVNSNGTLDISPTFANGRVALIIGIERDWEFIQDGTGSGTNMKLYSSSSKKLLLGGATNGTALEVQTGSTPGVRIPNGSVSVPSLGFINETDTGVYHPSTNQWAVAVNGSQELLLGTTGFFVPNVYNVDNSGGRNARVDSNGQLHSDSSARRTKTNETPADYLAGIKLQPVKFKKRGSDWFSFGLIADDLAAQNPLLATYVEDEVDDYNDRAVLAVMAAKINRLERLLEAA